MTSKVWVFLAVTLASIGAGVAVAGIPEGRSVELSDVVTAPTIDSATPPDDSTPTTAPDVTPTTETTTPPATTPTTDDTTPATSPEPDTTTVAESTTTEPPPSTSSTVAETSPSTTRATVDRLELSIVVANGASIAGAAGDTAELLAAAGYPNVRTLDGAEIVAASAVFADAGLQAEAERLATDLGIDPALVFPISSVPEVLGDFDEPLVVYLGTDAAELL